MLLSGGDYLFSGKVRGKGLALCPEPPPRFHPSRPPVRRDGPRLGGDPRAQPGPQAGRGGLQGGLPDPGAAIGHLCPGPAMRRSSLPPAVRTHCKYN